MPGSVSRASCRKAGEKQLFGTIIRGPANEILYRMPVILPRDAWRRWLGEDRAGVDELLSVLRPYPAELLRDFPVGQRVGPKQRANIA